ncbi:MAG: type IV toxin-antitoxin system AbiEi family antitoxin domain-containing protein [Gemmatimonadota bacterium]
MIFGLTWPSSSKTSLDDREAGFKMRYVSELLWKSVLPLSPVFTTAELAEAAEIRLSNASRDLAKLASRGMITRVKRGLWADTRHADFSPYAVVPHLFREGEAGYVSLLSALNLHGMIEQIPRVVQIVTSSQRAPLKTPVGAYEFHRIQAVLFGGYEPYGRLGEFDIARPSKALFDALYLSSRRTRRFSHLPELEFVTEFSTEEMESWIARIEHAPLRAAVRNRWMHLRDRIRRR